MRNRDKLLTRNMISTQLFWIDGPWPGKLALAARPRGGDWLEDEMNAWAQSGVGTVVSLLTPDEELSLGLEQESAEATAHEMRFTAFPIEDRQVPSSPSELAQTLEELDNELQNGRNVVVHCRQGVGRSGLVGACLLVNKGLNSQRAIDLISAARGIPVPETAEQRRWIDFYASSFAGA